LDHICKVKANRIVDDKLLVVPVKLQGIFVKQKISFNICLLGTEIFLAVSKHDNETKLTRTALQEAKQIKPKETLLPQMLVNFI
jgi:hypothetical protein